MSFRGPGLSALMPALILLASLPTFAQLLIPQKMALEPTRDYGKLPLSFEANMGQTDPTVQFLSHGQGYTLFLRPGEAVFSLSGAKPNTSKGKLPANSESPAVVRLQLLGASPDASVIPQDRQLGVTNYFLGKDPARWRTGVPNYAKVVYRHVYEGIDLVYYGTHRMLEHDFMVAPRADPSQIHIAFPGSNVPTIEASGDLKITLNSTEVILRKPVIYQVKSGHRDAVGGGYALLEDATVTFRIGDYDRSRELIIDPILTYSTYLGGSSTENATAIAVDAAGSAYITGNTNSTDFPTLNPFEPARTTGFGSPSFVSKLTPDGTALVYSTFLGGSGGDTANGIAVDSAGNAYIAGTTASTNFPLLNPIQGTLKGTSNAFITKLNPQGSALVFSTYLGGTATDTVAGIALDPQLNIYLAGTTTSIDFPTTANAFQLHNGAAGFTTDVFNQPGSPTNPFVTKINAAGNALVYSTYLGGSGNFSQTGYLYQVGADSASGIAVDSLGEAVVVGTTLSNDFPTQGPIQPKNNAQFETSNFTIGTASNGFVTKLNADGTGLVFSTYLGGGGAQFGCSQVMGDLGDNANAVAVDSAGNVFATGATRSPDFPTKNPIQPFLGANTGNSGPNFGYTQVLNTNAFITAYKADGSAYIYSTFLGGNGYDSCPASAWDNPFGYCYTYSPPCPVAIEYNGDAGNAIAVDSTGAAYVAGTTGAHDFPVRNAYQNLNLGSITGFLSKLKPDGTATLYSTYFGGTSSDLVHGIALDSQKNAYLVGQANSSDLPISPGAFQANRKGVSDAFVTKLNLGQIQQIAFYLPPSAVLSDRTYDLSPTARTSTGQPLQFAVLSGPAAMTGSMLNFNGVGQVLIQAYAPASQTYSGVSARQTINITPATVTVAALNATMTYGDPVPPLSYAPFLGLVAADPSPCTSGSPKLSTTATSASPAGMYPIMLALNDLTFYANDSFIGCYFPNRNYLQVSRNATLLVNKARLVLTPASFTVTYGSKLPKLTYSLTGFLNIDTQATTTSGAPLLTTLASPTAPIGRYNIKVDYGTFTSPYYNVYWSNPPSVITIVRAPLVIAAQNITIKQGAIIPNLGYTITGFVNNEDPKIALTGEPKLTTTATSKSPVGTYPIVTTRGSLIAPNYVFSQVNGTLTIIP